MIDFAPKLAIVAAKLAEVGPSWPQVGSKMAPRRPKICPNWVVRPGDKVPGGVREGASRTGQPGEAGRAPSKSTKNEIVIIEIIIIKKLLVIADKMIAPVTSEGDKGAYSISTIFPCILPIIKVEDECENDC